MTAQQYRDQTLIIDADTLTISGYYFPWRGTKRVPLSEILSVVRVPLSPLGGGWRIWGSTTFVHWANFDFRRPEKHTGFVIEVGKGMKPFITPDDPDAFETVLRAALPYISITSESSPRFGV